jgi:hypothetical protein
LVDEGDEADAQEKVKRSDDAHPPFETIHAVCSLPLCRRYRLAEVAASKPEIKFSQLAISISPPAVGQGEGQKETRVAMLLHLVSPFLVIR